MLSKSHEITSKNDYYSLFFYAEKALASLYFCTGSPESSSRYFVTISCAGSNGDLCTVYMNRECSGGAAPATMAHLGNHQCVVSMRQKCSQYVVIKFLNKTLATLPRKKKHKVVIVFMLSHVNMITAVLRHAYSPQFRQLHLPWQISRTVLDLPSKP